ncbi:hypothetical protein [Sandaracinus amylolyticus]|uniref:Uncharacterized protein n=1 Tax=Sandaracinus amylolyticus TaxID=927083 RepID=A0A0F6SHM6_9BACT|nr:hypothetical protein [Sandaracinus amylolyticus]AKF10709.1 hypothetical protein DB32_007858 [Sandaracinus amylolyticus]
MRLNVSFPPPGFFLNDPRLVVTLGDRMLYDGSFRDGFSVSVEIEPGEHVLETAIHLAGTIARKQRFELKLDPASGFRQVAIVDAKLTYSRLSGNFDKRVSLSTRG